MTNSLKRFLFFNAFLVSVLIGKAQLVSPFFYTDTLPKNERWIIDSIVFEGNKLTHTKVLSRELLISPCDTLSSIQLVDLVGKTCNNLKNLSLFNFVTPAYKCKSNEHVTVKFIVVERWYIWPYPVFEIADRNFNAWWRAKNFSRVNYGINLQIENFRGHKETLAILAKLGFDRRFGFQYSLPSINRSQTLGLNISYSISANHEVAYATDSSNQINFIRNDELFLKTEHQFAIGVVYRPNFYQTHTAELEFGVLNLDQEVVDKNPNYGPMNAKFLSLHYLIKDDHRDYKHYPLKGYYIDMGASKIGIPMLDAGEIDYWSVEGTYRKYWSFGSKWYAALGAYGRLVGSGVLPYFIQSGLGYGRYFVRGYEYYVVDGQKIALMKANLKYALVPTRVMQISQLKTEKFNKLHYAFYVNLFTDAGYAEGKYKPDETTLSGKLLYSVGLGLDFVTYYDKVLRVEYSVNRLGESGIFVHFIASI